MFNGKSFRNFYIGDVKNFKYDKQNTKRRKGEEEEKQVIIIEETNFINLFERKKMKYCH